MITTWNSEFITGYIECECCCTDHLMRLLTTKHEDVVYVDVKLNPKLNWFNRLKLAINYIFKREQNGFGEYECSIINKKDINNMIKILEEMRYQNNTENIQND